MPAHPWKSAKLLLTIPVLLCAVWVGAQPPQRRPPAGKAELSRQWKEVRAKYPLVAAAHLEILLTQLELASTIRAQTVCDLPHVANSRLCRDGGPTPPVGCNACKPASGPEDQERYLSCLEKRITCLG